MTKNFPEVDVVIVGMGWTGGILSKELSEAGLKVVALERGAHRSAEDDFSVPRMRDELQFSSRQGLMQDLRRESLTIRNNVNQTALPMRQLGSFLPGEGLGGAGVHWNGNTWRWTNMEFKIRTMYEERYGKKFIPEDMTIQDWGITYEELEPFYEKFERTAGISGKAGNISGVIQEGGNPFEATRKSQYPLPPLNSSLASDMFARSCKTDGLTSFQCQQQMLQGPTLILMGLI
jgi:gluconate 2-dehydrogenase alpha chain